MAIRNHVQAVADSIDMFAGLSAAFVKHIRFLPLFALAFCFQRS
jgi:hypothetical protein